MISDRMYEWARIQPEKIALIQNEVSISYGVLAQAIEVARIYFAQKNLPYGKTAVVIIERLRDAWINVLALRSLGLVTICAHSMAAARELNIGDVACVVTTQADIASQRLHGSLPAGAQLVIVPSEGHGVAGGDIAALPREAHRHGGHLLYTSGTTGLYKKVLQKGEDEDVMLERLSRIRSVSRDDVFHALNFPLWTAAGFRSPLARWYAGGTVMLDQRPGMLRGVLAPEVTNTFLIGPMLKKLLDEYVGEPVRKKRFEVSMGAGFIPLSLVEKAKQVLGAKIVNVYASTECPEVLRSTIRDKEDIYWFEPVADRTIEIVDDDGEAVGVDEEGELRIGLMRGDADGYHDDADASARFFRSGYFYPGDLAVRRADGRIRILGRASDVLNVQGFKLAAAPLEEKARAILGVAIVCMFSALNEAGEEDLVIAIEGKGEPAKSVLDDLRSAFARLGNIRIETVAEFPRTEAGMQKVNRRELRKRVLGEA